MCKIFNSMPMKKKVNHYIRIGFMLCIICIVSCKSVLEEDIEGQKVSINAPNAPFLNEYTQTFWWNAMDGVTQYEVQLVRGSFDHIQNLVLDSITTGTKLSYTLIPGDYEWRIRGINGGYKSEYNGSKFTMLVSDIKNQYVLLTSPANTGYSNASPLMLTWATMYGADRYQIQVDKNNAFTTSMSVNTYTPATSYAFSPAEETVFYWRVRVFNNNSDSSLWSSVNSFTYDVTAPDKVVLTSPANNLTDLNTTTGTLKWTSLGTGIKYIVYTQYDSGVETQTSPISANSYGYTGTDGQTVKWRVQAVDQAGNKGVISDLWQFKIQ